MLGCRRSASDSTTDLMRFILLVLVVLSLPGLTRAQATEVHEVQSGQTLYSIAQQYGTSVDRLQELNDLQSAQLTVGQRLRVPATGTDTPDGYHRIREGETLYSVAARYGVAVDSLRASNPDLEVTRPLPADSLLALPRTFQTLTYDVESGNTLIGIAREFGVSVEALREQNDLEGNRIQAGQRLEIPARTVPDPRPPGSLGPVAATGPVTVFPDTYVGRLMASGRAYRPDRLLVSHPDLPFGAVVLLTNPVSGRSTFALVGDRGPVEAGTLVDVSERVAGLLALEEGSDQTVELRVVDR